MPDIAMCLDIKCPSKEKCFRFTAKPLFAQTYGSFKAGKNGRCKEFWPNAYAPSTNKATESCEPRMPNEKLTP